MRRIPLAAPDLGAGSLNLVLSGPMGVGKSSVGREVSERLGLPLFDLDEIIASRAGTSVSELFRRDGEQDFRKREALVLEEAQRLSGAVIATGGGAVLHREAFRALAQPALSFLLHCDRAELLRRLRSGPSRPLLEDDMEASLERILGDRSAAYALAGRPIDCTHRSVPQIAEQLSELYRRSVVSPTQIPVEGPDGDYPVVVGPGALSQVGDLATAQLPALRRATVISDLSVSATVGEAVAASFNSAGVSVSQITVPGGEQAKQLPLISSLWDFLLSQGVDRQDLVVAVGGGAVLDAVGFAAATYARGLPLINVPTTLLAMADASVGGKVAIDYGSAKNSVGAFHHPRLVLSDVDCLATLSATDLRTGLAEIIKCGVLASPLVLDLIGHHPRQARTPATMSWLVEQAVRVKAAYIREDPQDHGPRHSLNLGHTFAHGIEAASGYSISHGQAVGIGLLASAKLAVSLDLAPGDLPTQIQRLLEAVELPSQPPRLDLEAVRGSVLVDKKRRAGEAVFIIPSSPGAIVLEGIDLDLALSFLDQPEDDGQQSPNPAAAAAAADHMGQR